MRRTLLIAGLVAAVAAPSIASAESCAKRAHDRRMTGAVVGGIGGALIGNAITRDSTGAILGGLGGAVAGNQIARTSCDRPHSSSRARARTYRSSERYDRPRETRASYHSSCRYENRPYYDARGQLVYARTQVCR